MKSILYYLLPLLFFLCFGSHEGYARKKKVKETQTLKETLTPYQKLFKGKRVSTSKGLMTVHIVDGKAYVEFPVNLLGKDLMYSTSIEDICDNGEGIVGQFSDDGCVFRFTKNDSVVYARMVVVSEPVNETGNPNMTAAIEKSKMPGIQSIYKIEAYTPDSSAIVLDMTKFFLEHFSYASPFPGMAGNSMLGFISRVHKPDVANSRLRGIRAYPSTVMATCELLYKVDYYMMGRMNQQNIPVTLTVNRMLSVLPESPMMPRIADPRIGVAFMEKSGIEGSFKGLSPVYYTKRWRLEPSDNDAYARGEKVEPKKPIVIYMDSLVPPAWKSYVREGIEAWNTAFAEIGFKNVIRVLDFPKDDPDFNANDIAHSVVRYSPSWSYMPQNSLLVDPRSGEILNASIYIHNNSVSVMQRERILATMGADPSVRRTQLSDNQAGELIRAAMIQYMGMNLGLLPNFAASNAYPVDSLRSVSFTREHGLTASIMDQMQYNYVAQPEDVEKGVLLVPDAVGPYDRYAIRWLYQPIPDARSSREEIPVLDCWIDEKAGDPVYRYALKQYPMFAYDPSVLTGDLGNDPVKSFEYFKKNLKRFVEGFYDWYSEGDKDMSYRALLLGRIGFMFNGKLDNVLSHVGGIYMDEVKVGDGRPAFQVVPREQQREIVRYVIAQAKDIDWLRDPRLLQKFDVGMETKVTRTAIMGALLGRISRLALCVEKDPDAYSPEELVDDVYREIWKGTIAGRSLTKEEIMLQQGLLGSIAVTSQAASPAGTFESVRKITADGTPMHAVCGTGKAHDHFYGFYPTMTKIEANRYSTAPLFYSMLLKTRDLIRGALPRATGETKRHYEFMLYKINKMLK